MDIFTHALFACSIGVSIPKIKKQQFFILVIAGLIPDIGEIVIQMELASKYDALFAVYDERTSDISVAATPRVTFIYDILHSFVTPIILLLSAFIITRLNKIVIYIAVGIISHIFLDSFTHGKVWALKLFFPLSNQRFKLFAETVGNWWDWSPKISLFFLQLPILCMVVWFFLLLFIFGTKFLKKPNP